MQLVIEEKISLSPEELLIHQRKLGAFTEARLGRPLRFGEGLLPCHLFARDEIGALVAGAYGYSNLGSFMIEAFWVEEGRRRAGLGKSLFDALEKVARQRGCRQIIGSMLGFHQSLDFFLKMGGTRFAMLPGVAEGLEIYYVHKVLS